MEEQKNNEQKFEDVTVISEEEKKESKKKQTLILAGFLTLALLIIIAGLIFRFAKLKSTSKTKFETPVKEEKIYKIEKFSYEIAPFPNRSANIKNLIPKIQKIEEELISKISQLPPDKKVKVYGHTSREKNKQNPKKEEGNMVLSTQRAEAVINYLCSKYNIPKSRFEIIPMGSKELKVKKPTWSEANRRVEIKVE